MFETALVASRKTAVLGNPKLLPVAILAHGLLLAGGLTATYWNVEEVPEPELVQSIQVTLPPPPMEAPPAPPAPPAPAPPTTTVTAPTPPVPTTVDVPPVTLEDIPATPPAVDTPVTTTFQGTASTDTDTGPGCPGCGGIGPGGGGGDGEILVVGGAVTAPVILQRVLPTYTEAARRARVEGTVILEAIIGSNGAVHGVRVLKSLPMGLDQQAIDAVQRWKFRPGRRGEQAVNVYFTLTVRFELQ